MYDAIILAGGENSKQLSRFSSQPYEALIDIAGRPMVTYVAQALAASGQVDRILVVGPVEALKSCHFPPRTEIFPSGVTIMDTIRQGMSGLKHNRNTLVATADIPLLTAESVNHFLQQCSRIKADLYYPIVTEEVNEKAYPGVKRTYVRFREGTFTGGNLFLVNPSIVPGCVALAERIIDNRKNPLKLCHMLGWSFVVKFVLGMLDLQQVEQRVSELLGIQGAVIESPYAELGIDVDKPSDYELVQNTFAVRT